MTSILHRSRKLVSWILVSFLWTLLLGFGGRLLFLEAYTPVVETKQADSFPPSSSLPLDRLKPTLFFFAHPHCPCTRASFHELQTLQKETGDSVSYVLVFTEAPDLSPPLEESLLWKKASSLPGLKIIRDAGGTEARRLGVKGSGNVLLYLPSGSLLFSGGITGSRGHEGDNPGRSALAATILQKSPTLTRTPVFGCSLL